YMDVFCNPARRPRFAVHGKLPLPKSKSEAGCTGWGKAERQKARLDPVIRSFSRIIGTLSG
ncbi:MAG: hypothetical protein KAS57_03570, partial [Gammaproteobacteria bacterium]|nr:hypothetical protein [Gammaproteobacteria bacterium]